MCIALAAYSCRDSRGSEQEQPALTAFLFSPSRGTGAIFGPPLRPNPGHRQWLNSETGDHHI